MKQPITLLCTCAAAVTLVGVFAQPTKGQQPAAPNTEAIEIARLIGEIEQQQTQLIANQDAMEKRMAAIADELRLARIHATRGGGVGK